VVRVKCLALFFSPVGSLGYHTDNALSNAGDDTWEQVRISKLNVELECLPPDTNTYFILSSGKLVMPILASARGKERREQN
jgi:hypothetical protein